MMSRAVKRKVVKSGPWVVGARSPPPTSSYHPITKNPPHKRIYCNTILKTNSESKKGCMDHSFDHSLKFMSSKVVFDRILPKNARMLENSFNQTQSSDGSGHHEIGHSRHQHTLLSKTIHSAQKNLPSTKLMQMSPQVEMKVPSDSNITV